MAWNKLSNYATTIAHDGTGMVVTYHRTQIVRFNSELVTLRTGGHRTVTTKKKMCQASHQFSLNYSVFSKDFEWFVKTDSGTFPFDSETFTFDRATGKPIVDNSAEN